MESYNLEGLFYTCDEENVFESRFQKKVKFKTYGLKREGPLYCHIDSQNLKKKKKSCSLCLIATKFGTKYLWLIAKVIGWSAIRNASVQLTVTPF